MIDGIFKLLSEMDSFKKIALFLLTGITALCIWLGYRLVDNYSVYQSWSSIPHILKTELPCSLVQIRKDFYLVSISFPVPSNASDSVKQFTSSLWVNDLPKRNEFTGLCRSLVQGINSNEAETLLAPYLERMK